MEEKLFELFAINKKTNKISIRLLKDVPENLKEKLESNLDNLDIGVRDNYYTRWFKSGSVKVGYKV